MSGLSYRLTDAEISGYALNSYKVTVMSLETYDAENCQSNYE